MSSKYLEVRAAMFEVMADSEVSFNLNSYANLGILSLSTVSMDATFTIQATHESFAVETMYGIEGYDTSNGDDVWDVPAIKAAIVKAFQATHGTSEN